MQAAVKQSVPGGRSLRVFVIELVIYAALVSVYLLVVLRSLSPLLLAKAEGHKVVYAALSLLLMLGQGVLLEFLTSLLVGRFARARREDERES